MANLKENLNFIDQWSNIFSEKHENQSRFTPKTLNEPMSQEDQTNANFLMNHFCKTAENYTSKLASVIEEKSNTNEMNSNEKQEYDSLQNLLFDEKMIWKLFVKISKQRDLNSQE